MSRRNIGGFYAELKAKGVPFFNEVKGNLFGKTLYSTEIRPTRTITNAFTINNIKKTNERNRCWLQYKETRNKILTTKMMPMGKANILAVKKKSSVDTKIENLTTIYKLG